ncbi:MAG: hypothetical protein Q9204_007633 [Flavoplaca sp. TL-2023a]
MASKYPFLLLSLALAAKCQSSNPADPFTGNPAPSVNFDTENNQGFCYFCSTSGAPKLCNSACEIAYTGLCGQKNLNIGWTNIEGDCEVNYFPPATKLPLPADFGQTCRTNFDKILKQCGREAGDPNPWSNQYCTSSGGGGAFGWNDDGSAMDAQGRYKITTKNTNQCGQRQHLKTLADAVIQWNDTWIQETDEVIYDANPPDLTDFPAPPEPNKLCDVVECDVKDRPYYASKGRIEGQKGAIEDDGHANGANWGETEGYYRHRIYWAGWADSVEATELLDALNKRCPSKPYNFQAWVDGDSHAADVGLVHTASEDHCWCIADAVFDASGGIKMDRNTWCEEAVTGQPHPEFSPVDDTAETDPNMGDCEIKPDPTTGRVTAPGQCAAGANNGYQAPANVANPPVTNPNQAPANAANPPPTGKKSRKMKRTPEQQRVVKRYLEEEVGPMFNMVPRNEPAAQPKTPRRMKRTGMW